GPPTVIEEQLSVGLKGVDSRGQLFRSGSTIRNVEHLSYGLPCDALHGFNRSLLKEEHAYGCVECVDVVLNLLGEKVGLPHTSTGTKAIQFPIPAAIGGCGEF